MYFGGVEDKCCEKPQMFGRIEGDYIMIMPPIKLKTILEPTIVFLILLIIIVSSYRVLLVYYGQTRVYCNVPTKPLAHWPFRRQTAEWPEVSPKVILDGLAKDSSVLNQVL